MSRFQWLAVSIRPQKIHETLAKTEVVNHEGGVEGVTIRFTAPSQVRIEVGVARNFKPDDAALTDTIRTGQHTIFSEYLQLLPAVPRGVTKP